MMQSKKGFGNLVWHENVNMASSIIPGNGGPKVAGSGPISGECILSSKSIEEVISIRLKEEFDAKVVNSKGKGCALLFLGSRRGRKRQEVGTELKEVKVGYVV
jgi:hypothetical protein